jgi:hypothetical protein
MLKQTQNGCYLNTGLLLFAVAFVVAAAITEGAITQVPYIAKYTNVTP